MVRSTVTGHWSLVSVKGDREIVLKYFTLDSLLSRVSNTLGELPP